MERDDTSVSRLGSLHCRAAWVEGELLLTILSGTSAWSGRLGAEDFTAIGAKAGGGRKGEELAREAFAGPSANFSFSLEGGRLVWRKVGGKAKLKLQEIELCAVSFTDAQDDLFNYLVNTNGELQTENNVYAERQESLVGELEKAKAMLTDFEKVKDELEDRLYESFLPILNEKKAKIRELEEQLSGSEGTKMREASDDYGGDTDEDSEEGTGCPGRGEKRRSDGAEANELKSSKFDDSLNLLDDI